MSGDKLPARWPHYALRANEDASALAAEIERLARAMILAAREGRMADVLLAAGDIRMAAMDIRELLRKAKAGER